MVTVSRRRTATGDFARCARRWARLTTAGRLTSPRGLVGATLCFDEGTPC